MPAKAKLNLKTLTDQEIVDLANSIAVGMADDTTTFPAPNPPLTDLTTLATGMKNTMIGRDDTLIHARALTMQIHEARFRLEAALNNEAEYADNRVETLDQTAGATALLGAGMAVADSTGSPVGPMPKIEGLTATQGDADGEIDLSWNPVKRGLQNYFIEQTTDPAGLTGWAFAANSRKSKISLTGLTLGQRSWFRVTAEGASGKGPTSDPATKVAR